MVYIFSNMQVKRVVPTLKEICRCVLLCFARTSIDYLSQTYFANVVYLLVGDSTCLTYQVGEQAQCCCSSLLLT